MNLRGNFQINFKKNDSYKIRKNYVKNNKNTHKNLQFGHSLLENLTANFVVNNVSTTCVYIMVCFDISTIVIT